MQFKPSESKRSNGGGERVGRMEREGPVEFHRGGRGGGGGEVFKFNPLICPSSSAESFSPRWEDELCNCAKLCLCPVRDEQSSSVVAVNHPCVMSQRVIRWWPRPLRLPHFFIPFQTHGNFQTKIEVFFSVLSCGWLQTKGLIRQASPDFFFVSN